MANLGLGVWMPMKRSIASSTTLWRLWRKRSRMPQKRPVGKMVVKTGIVGGPSRVTTAEATTRAHRPLLRTRTAVVTAISTAGAAIVPHATIAVATVRRLRPEGTIIAVPRATAASAVLTMAADTVATPRTTAVVAVSVDMVVVAARGNIVSCE